MKKGAEYRIKARDMAEGEKPREKLLSQGPRAHSPTLSL